MLDLFVNSIMLEYPKHRRYKHMYVKITSIREYNQGRKKAKRVLIEGYNYDRDHIMSIDIFGSDPEPVETFIIDMDVENQKSWLVNHLIAVMEPGDTFEKAREKAVGKVWVINDSLNRSAMKESEL